MRGLRHKTWGRFGALVAGTALTLQLAFSSWGMLLTASSAATADPFAGHALCLAGSDGAPPAVPANRQPAAPLHAHDALCCLWHPLSAVQANPVLTPEPIAFAAIGTAGRGEIPFLPGPQHGPANARAPPTLA